MGALTFLTKMSRQEKGICEQATKEIDTAIRLYLYGMRKKYNLIPPRMRVAIWLPRENGETMQIEREFQVDLKSFEEAFQKLDKKKQDDHA